MSRGDEHHRVFYHTFLDNISRFLKQVEATFQVKKHALYMMRNSACREDAAQTIITISLVTL